MSEPDGFMLSLVWVAPVSFGRVPDGLQTSSDGSGWLQTARYLLVILGGVVWSPDESGWS